MKTHNGFPYLVKGEKCGGCGEPAALPEDEAPSDYPDDFGDYKLECPECYREGCEKCMPMGRGCMCPECEEAE